MQENIKMALNTLFEAYAVVEDDRFAEISPAAAKLLPENAAELAASAVLPLLLTIGEGGAETAPYRFGGEDITVTVLPSGGRTLVVFQPRARAQGIHIAGERLGYVIRSSLSSGMAASNLLFVDDDALQLSPEVKSYVAMLFKSQYRLLRTASNLSDFIAFNNGSLKLQLSEVDAARLCRDTVEAAAPLLTGRKLSLSCECEPESFIACLDRSRIEQLILNLISNSAKYTQSGGAITLRFAADAKNMRITVSDNGPGIDPEIMSTLFSRYTAQPAADDPQAGAGFGLAMVMLIARLHGGTVIVDNRPGEGVSVTASLPVRHGLPTVSTKLLRPSLQQGYGSVFAELADVLDSDVYLPAFLD